MREILYRQWDGKKFHYWGIGLNENTFVGPISGGNPPINPSTTTHQQYTGLKDKNGKKIFEGDIVLIDYTEPLIGEVIYISDDYKQNPGFYLCREESGFGQQTYHFSSQDNREVIGNIYENQELLATQEETA